MAPAIVPEQMLPPAPRHSEPPARTASRAPAAPPPHAERAPARSGVERLRAAAVTVAAQVGLAALERAVVSGDASRLREAVRRLPPGLARAKALAAPEPAAEEGDTHADEPRADAPAQEHAHAPAPAREGAQQPSLRLDLPLPDGGEARVAVEHEEGAAAGGAHRVDVELELAELGSVGVHLVSDESRLLCRVDCADRAVRARLEDALAQLESELAAATGKPVAVAVRRAAPQAPRLRPLGGGLDAYA